ncbi:MFS transporter [Nocardioides sp. BP30]|uniref:MFS transporter n=1 Tax=Nocardioides sp. BP30 TaxID=3036374 RepID=UPI00246863B7|nr:MFS transporter [Nocardioides sp. BP30]WGL51355.1 MFS transporter [Nocardioides sp. BP30]
MTSAPTDPRVDPATARGVYGWRFLAPLFIGPLLNPINTTMISVALSPISHSLHISSATVLWLVAGLYLTSAIAQPTMGRIGDIMGPRRVYLAGLVVVMAAGVLPQLAPGFTPVLISRILLGVGTSAAYPSVMALVRERSDRAGIETPPAVLAGISISTLTSSVIGPVLGGLLIALGGWHAIFLVNIPLALLALVMTVLWVPSDGGRRRTDARFRDLDPIGIGLFGLTIAGLLVFLIHLDAPVWWLLPATLIAFGALLGWELRRQQPFIDFRMLAGNGALTRTYLRMLLLYFGSYTMTYGYSQWVQDAAGFSSSQAGFLQLPTAVLAGLVSLTIARTTKVWLPLLLTGVFPLVGGAFMLGIDSERPLAYLLVMAGVFGLGQGLASISNQQVLYRQAPPAQLGTASGLSRTFVYLGAILASGVLGATFGESPSDGDMHLIGLIILSCSAGVVLLVLLDRGLRGHASSRAGRAAS